MNNWWRVEVTTHDGTLVAIEPEMLAGKGPLDSTEEEIVRNCAKHLLSFVGPAYVVCTDCGADMVVGYEDQHSCGD